MSLADAIAHTVVEATNYVLTKILGRTFHLDSTRAQRISECVLLIIFVLGITVLTVIYS